MRHSRTSGALAAALLAVLTAGGCAIQKPTLALRDIEVAAIGFHQIDLVLDFAVTNPNDFGINLYGLDYELTAGGGRLAGGSLPRPVGSLEPNRTIVVKAPVSVTYGTLKPLVSAAKSGEAIDYEMTTTATFNVFGVKVKVPLRRSGKIPPLRSPSWRFTDIRLVMPGPAVEVSFEVDNPNPFALPLKALTGVVKVGDRPVLRVSGTTLDPIPPKEKRTVTVPVKLDSAGVLSLLREGLADRRKLSFEGNLALDAPVSLHEFLLGHLAKEE